MTTYKVFEIQITNAKTGKTEYTDYAITVTDDTIGNAKALEAATTYAKRRISRYKAGSTFTITEI